MPMTDTLANLPANAGRKKRDRQAGLLLEVATKVAAAETLDDILRLSSR